MLASVLPGLRELRAPLAAGYLWLLAGWLLLDDRVPSDENATGIWRSLRDLSDVVSAIGLGVAVSFAAYVVGSVSVAMMSPVLSWVYRYVRLRKFRFQHPHQGREPFKVAHQGEPGRRMLFRVWAEYPVVGYGTLSGAASAIVREHVLSRVRRGAGFVPNDLFSTSWSYAELVTELRLIEQRLIGNETELYAEADRLRSEAEFRAAVTPPLALLALLFAGRSSLLWLLGMPIIAALYAQGQLRLRDRNDLLVQAVALGRVEAPALERLALRLEINEGSAGATSRSPSPPDHAPAATTPDSSS
jgi:hypothetical protein